MKLRLSKATPHSRLTKTSFNEPEPFSYSHVIRFRKTPRNVRRVIRYESARILVDGGSRDFQRVKRKACARLGLSERHNLPTNLEIEESLSDQLQLFSKQSTGNQHTLFLTAAAHLMRQLRDFSPYLTGAALSGVITKRRPIEIHVFASTVEEVCDRLASNSVGFEQTYKRMRFAKQQYHQISAFRFTDGEINFEVMVFLSSDPYPPLSTINGKPMPRASLKRVNKMLAEISA